MKINPTRLWTAAILTGWTFDFLFWKQPFGLNFAAFLTLCLLLGTVLLLADGVRPAAKSLLLLIPFLFFASVTFLRREPLTVFLGGAFALFSLGVFVVTYLSGHWLQYGLFDYLRRFVELLWGMLTRGRQFHVEVRRERIANGEPPSKFPFLAMLRGALIAAPILFFFTILLANADLVFNHKLTSYFEDFDFWEHVLRLILILACAYLAAGLFLHTASRSRDESLGGERQPWKHPLGFTEAAIVLGSVALLFASFVLIQFQYFFGGQTNIGVEGFTFSEYARRGFNELITVACFSLVLILGLGILTRREAGRERGVYSALSVVIVTEIMVMLVSAWQRLQLAIDWHGFSRLRLYPSVFMVWLGILLLVVVILEIARLERYFALAFVLASLGFGVSLTFANVDASIVTHNLERVAQGKNLNVPHLASLSADAVPALVREFMDPTLPVGEREGIGAILVCYAQSRDLQAEEETDWRSFNLSRWQAMRALEQVQPMLSDYRYNKPRYPPRVRTPGQSTYFCLDTAGAEE
jgi:hypothetical protein